MQHRYRIITGAVALALFISGTALAVGPGSGELTKTWQSIGSCRADSVTVKYHLDSMMGEPTVNGSFKWEGPDCRLPSSTVILLHVRTSTGTGGYVRLDPVIPGRGEGYGFNVTGSPSWSRAICEYSDTTSIRCLDTETAKQVWRTGSVLGFQIVW